MHPVLKMFLSQIFYLLKVIAITLTILFAMEYVIDNFLK